MGIKGKGRKNVRGYRTGTPPWKFGVEQKENVCLQNAGQHGEANKGEKPKERGPRF